MRLPGDPETIRCGHTSFDMEGRIRVNIHRCKNRTKDPSGFCWRHREEKSR